MILHEKFERQGHNLISSASAVPLFVLILGYIFLGAVEDYPKNYFLQKSIYEEIYELTCLLFSLSGFLILLYTNGYSSNSSLAVKSKQYNLTSFNINGSYSVVRHPLYLGTSIMWLGPALVTGNLFFIISYVLFCCIYFERIMLAEEQHLKKIFGEKYKKWAEKIPALIPKISRFKRPNSTFSWKRASRESTGKLTQVLLAFFIFDLMTEVIVEKPNYNTVYFTLFAIAMVMTTIIEIKRLIQIVKTSRKRSLS